jgi:hypothetical protein
MGCSFKLGPGLWRVSKWSRCQLTGKMTKRRSWFWVCLIHDVMSGTRCCKCESDFCVVQSFVTSFAHKPTPHSSLLHTQTHTVATQLCARVLTSQAWSRRTQTPVPKLGISTRCPKLHDNEMKSHCMRFLIRSSECCIKPRPPLPPRPCPRGQHLGRHGPLSRPHRGPRRGPHHGRPGRRVVGGQSARGRRQRGGGGRHAPLRARLSHPQSTLWGAAAQHAHVSARHIDKQSERSTGM